MASHVFFFGDGKAEGDPKRRDLLGGKGAGLAEMTSLGLPVPAGFTISTEVCADLREGGQAPCRPTCRRTSTRPWRASRRAWG